MHYANTPVCLRCGRRLLSLCVTLAVLRPRVAQRLVLMFCLSVTLQKRRGLTLWVPALTNHFHSLHRSKHCDAVYTRESPSQGPDTGTRPLRSFFTYANTASTFIGLQSGFNEGTALKGYYATRFAENVTKVKC